jgi:hypothetical protein
MLAAYAMLASMLRYVILLHETPPNHARGTHYDVMLESAGVLRTWAIPQPPVDGCEIAAELLPEHRLYYLQHEGEVSGGRGSVSRWDAGTYKLHAETDLALEVEVTGERLRGKLTLTRESLESTQWRLRYVRSLYQPDA